jgi:hypothetical protein
MPIPSRKTPLPLILCLLLAASVATDTALAQTESAPPKTTPKAPPNADNAKTDADDEDTPNDELEEAAVKIDVSRSSPLIQKLYQATRGTWNGREVWIGAATHDIDISKARANTKWGHRIDPHVDREREWIETDLLFAGTATSYALVDRPHVPKTTANGTGDIITTDGQLSIVELGATKPNILNPATPALQTRPTETSRLR